MKINNQTFIKNADLPQGSEKWLDLRRKFGMASECAAAMDCSPWMPKSPLQLWEVKNGITTIPVTPAMRHGTENESNARSALEMKMLCNFDPVVVTCDIDGVPMGASLDGYNKKKGIIAEIKVPVKGEQSSLWTTMVRGEELPIQYKLQTQQQLLVTGAKKLIFWVYDVNSHSAIMQNIVPDQKVQQKIYESWKLYWSYDQAPPAGEHDFIEREDDEWTEVSETWIKVHSQLDALSKREKELRSQLIDLSNDKSCTGGGIRFKRSEGKGRINYTKIPELENIDLEQYRSKPIIKYYITEIKS